MIQPYPYFPPSSTKNNFPLPLSPPGSRKVSAAAVRKKGTGTGRAGVTESRGDRLLSLAESRALLGLSPPSREGTQSPSSSPIP